MKAPVPSGLAKLAKRINEEHALADQELRSGLAHARTAGQLLLEAKEQCQHGEWLTWLSDNISFSERTAQAYMRVANRWEELEAKAQRVALLTFGESMRLLATPNEEVVIEAPPQTNSLELETFPKETKTGVNLTPPQTDSLEVTTLSKETAAVENPPAAGPPPTPTAPFVTLGGTDCWFCPECDPASEQPITCDHRECPDCGRPQPERQEAAVACPFEGTGGKPATAAPPEPPPYQPSYTADLKPIPQHLHIPSCALELWHAIDLIEGAFHAVAHPRHHDTNERQTWAELGLPFTQDRVRAALDHLQQACDLLGEAMPGYLCPRCNGDRCEHCRRAGIVPEHVWHDLKREVAA